MIRALNDGEESAFLQVLKSAPLYGQRIQTLYECYGRFPALCGFYRFAGGAVSVAGPAALIAGAPEDPAELGAFLALSGVQEAEGDIPGLPGYEVQALSVMRFSSQEGGFGPRRDIRLAEDPGEVLQILKNSGMAPDPAGFYADFCIRRNHGRLQVYLLYEKGAPVSTAGFYSLGEQEGYLLRCDHTGQQGQGICHGSVCPCRSSGRAERGAAHLPRRNGTGVRQGGFCARGAHPSIHQKGENT